MWCASCRQDMPGVAPYDVAPSAVAHALRCVRCGAILVGNAQAGSVVQANLADAKVHPSSAGVGLVSLPHYDGWELEQQLEHVRRVLARFRSTKSETQNQSPRAEPFRVDSGPSDRAGRALSVAANSSGTPAAGSANHWLSVLAWSVLSAGLATLTCGAILSVRGLVDGENDLVSFGLPATVGGQAALVVGLVLRLHLASTSSAAAPPSHADSDQNSPDYARPQHGVDRP